MLGTGSLPHRSTVTRQEQPYTEESSPVTGGAEGDPARRNRMLETVGPRAAAARFAAALRTRYGDALVNVRLFGSCARGEMREHSDVDVAVVLERVDGRTRRDVINLSADIGLAHCVLLSATVLDRETFERWRRQERALVLDIERDGLPL